MCSRRMFVVNATSKSWLKPSIKLRHSRILPNFMPKALPLLGWVIWEAPPPDKQLITLSNLSWAEAFFFIVLWSGPSPPVLPGIIARLYFGYFCGIATSNCQPSSMPTRRKRMKSCSICEWKFNFSGRKGSTNLEEASSRLTFRPLSLLGKQLTHVSSEHIWTSSFCW